MNWDTITEELRKPLDRKNVSQRTQAGFTLSYIEGWHAIDEANRIFGFGGWSSQTVELTEMRPAELVKTQKGDQWRVGFMAKVAVTVGNVVREGVGFGSGFSKDMGDAYESAIKEAETDARKRSLMTFGYRFGLALYDRTQRYVEDSGAAPATEPAPVARNGNGRISVHQAKQEIDWTKIVESIRTCPTIRKLDNMRERIHANEHWPESYVREALEECDKRADVLQWRDENTKLFELLDTAETVDEVERARLAAHQILQGMEAASNTFGDEIDAAAEARKEALAPNLLAAG